MKKSLLLLFLVSNTALAAVGKVTEQVNAVPTIQRQSSTLQGAKGTGVEMNDAIRTTQGKVGITFEDDTKVQVNENSKLVIDDFVYDPKSKGGKLGVKVALGTVRYASGAIAKNSPQNVAINTPSATVSVRGTDFTATVDEIGASTIILLPSCPFGWRDVERDCKTGEIAVESDAGQVILNKPFQATRVENRSLSPTRPVILKLTEDAISNMLIVAPPKEFKEDRTQTKLDMKGALDVDFLKETGLTNALDEQQKEVYQDKLSTNLLDQNFLQNILDIVNAQLAAQMNLLNTSNKSTLLPDYSALTGIVASVEPGVSVNLTRDDGSNVQSVTVPYNQLSVIYQTQGALDFKNRVNTGNATTTITLIQK